MDREDKRRAEEEARRMKKEVEDERGKAISLQQ